MGDVQLESVKTPNNSNSCSNTASTITIITTIEPEEHEGRVSPEKLITKENNSLQSSEEDEISFESLLEDLDDSKDKEENAFWKALEKFRNQTQFFWDKSDLVIRNKGVIAFALYNAYLILAIINKVKSDEDFGWCNGLGFLLICTSFYYSGLIYYRLLKPKLSSMKTPKAIKELENVKWLKSAVYISAVLALIIFLVLDTLGQPKRLVSGFGIFVILSVGVIISKHPDKIRLRIIIWGIGMQFIFGLLILRWDTGRQILQCVSDKLTALVDFSVEGAKFVYGYLATGIEIPGAGIGGEVFKLPGLIAFRGLTAIYLFTFLVEVLYHYGLMSWVVANLGWILEISVGTTAVESMTVAANVFLGITTAPLVVRPFIGKMTNSEIHTMMTGGFATIAGAAFGAYVAVGANGFHLLAASVMSAPAALVCAKILYPETKKSITSSKEVYSYKPKKSGNAMDAGIKGAIEGIYLLANICASIIAILGSVALFNHIVNWFGRHVGLDFLSFEWAVGKLFIPLAWSMGVDNEEVGQVADLLGTKTVVSSFVAYTKLGKMCLSPRSTVIVTYAMCCFADIAAIGVTLGGLTALAPKRAKDISKVVMRAFIAGNAAALLTACVAGALSTEATYSEWAATAECLKTS